MLAILNQHSSAYHISSWAVLIFLLNLWLTGTVPTLIVGSKTACADRVVSFSEVQAFAAANKVQYAECDAFDGCGVQEVRPPMYRYRICAQLGSLVSP